MNSSREHRISVICPARNEEGNLPELMGEFRKLFSSLGYEYEVVVVDDASTDGTPQALEKLKKEYKFLKTGRNRVRAGKAGGIVTGLGLASGDIVVIFDADLQYLPEDIPSLVQAVIEDGKDIVSGWRQGLYEKSALAKVYNWLLRALFDSPLHDSGATLALRREVIDRMALHEEWHRFIIPFALANGYTVGERKIRLYPRRHGQSNYRSKRRLLIGLLDLISVKMFLTFGRKPMLYFGNVGIVLLVAGTFFAVLYAIDKLTPQIFIPWRLGITPTTFLIISGLFFIFGGFMGEMLLDLKILLERILRESEKRKSDAGKS
ncbi:glycosyltransferase [Candidatus Poribacteria bacterium]|nr:glycosyltransferase [Candidatus Poribacteria bacterium]